MEALEVSACWVFGRCGPLHFCLEKCGSDQAGSVFNELDAPLPPRETAKFQLDFARVPCNKSPRSTSTRNVIKAHKPEL